MKVAATATTAVACNQLTDGSRQYGQRISRSRKRFRHH